LTIGTNVNPYKQAYGTCDDSELDATKSKNHKKAPGFVTESKNI
jgi:hypothetical protein